MECLNAKVNWNEKPSELFCCIFLFISWSVSLNFSKSSRQIRLLESWDIKFSYICIVPQAEYIKFQVTAEAQRKQETWSFPRGIFNIRSVGS